MCTRHGLLCIWSGFGTSDGLFIYLFPYFCVVTARHCDTSEEKPWHVASLTFKKLTLPQKNRNFHSYQWHSTFKCQCFCTVFWSSFWNFQRITLRLTKINICQKCLINYTKLAAKVESRNLCKWLNSRLLNPLVPNKSWFKHWEPFPFVNKLRFSTISSHTIFGSLRTHIQDIYIKL